MAEVRGGELMGMTGFACGGGGGGEHGGESYERRTERCGSCAGGLEKVLMSARTRMA